MRSIKREGCLFQAGIILFPPFLSVLFSPISNTRQTQRRKTTAAARVSECCGMESYPLGERERRVFLIRLTRTILFIFSSEKIDEDIAREWCEREREKERECALNETETERGKKSFIVSHPHTHSHTPLGLSPSLSLSLSDVIRLLQLTMMLKSEDSPPG